MPKPLNIGTDAAWVKIAAYCSYQERTHREVKEKLFSYGLYPHEVEDLTAKLIQENYLNEERFAIAYAGGKFRMNEWGKLKIKYSLQQKQVSAYCIGKALASIDADDYEALLKKLALEKLKTLKSEKNLFSKKQKLRNYLLQKGFEQSLISETLSGLKDLE